jgi:hypothetical protein
MSNVALYLSYARIAQYESAAKNRKDRIFKGGVLVPDYSRLLYILQTQIGKRFVLLPSDPTLTTTSEYMYSLSGGRTINTTPVTTPLIFIIQPNDNVVTVGMSVTFNALAVNGIAPIIYQWQKNGVNIGGATSVSLTINPVALSDAGVFDCVATDATGLSITSRIANLVVNSAPLTASWYWNASVDPYPALAGGSDTLTYLGTVNFNNGDPIVIPWPSGSANNVYRVVRYPISQGAKTAWVNTVGFNFGSVPGTAYHEIVTIGSFLYIISKGDSIFTPFIVTYT